MTNFQLCSGVGQYASDKTGDLEFIRWTDIQRLVTDPQRVEKPLARWAIPSALQTRSFKQQEADGEFWMIWADFDQDPQPIAAISHWWGRMTDACDAEFFSSRSATVEVSKSRILIPLAKPLCGSDWVLVSECLNDALQAAGFMPDRVSERPGQLCYLPNAGSFYDAYYYRDGHRLAPLTAFAEQIAAKRAAIAAEVAEVELRRQAAEANRLQFRASGSTSAVEAFNACHTVDEVLLKAGYQQRGSHFRHPHSESGSYSLSVKNGRAFALSASDPLFSTAGAHDAFSAWTILFHGGDQTAAAKVVYETMKGAA